MGRLIRTVVLTCAAAGCAVGPGYRRPEQGMPSEWRRTDGTVDSLRPFFDSLRANRDTLPLDPNPTGAVPVDTSPRGGVFLTDTTANLDLAMLGGDFISYWPPVHVRANSRSTPPNDRTVDSSLEPMRATPKARWLLAACLCLRADPVEAPPFKNTTSRSREALLPTT
jgi:hypothetical protein